MATSPLSPPSRRRQVDREMTYFGHVFGCIFVLVFALAAFIPRIVNDVYCKVKEDRNKAPVYGDVVQLFKMMDVLTIPYLSIMIVVCFFVSLCNICMRSRKLGLLVIAILLPVFVFRGNVIVFIIASNWKYEAWSCEMAHLVTNDIFQVFNALNTSFIFVFIDKLLIDKRLAKKKKKEKKKMKKARKEAEKENKMKTY